LASGRGGEAKQEAKQEERKREKEETGGINLEKVLEFFTSLFAAPTPLLIEFGRNIAKKGLWLVRNYWTKQKHQ